MKWSKQVFSLLIKYLDLHTKLNATANTDAPKPSWNPMATARAETVEEWDEGIPPDPTSFLKSHRLSLYLKS